MPQNFMEYNFFYYIQLQLRYKLNIYVLENENLNYKTLHDI